MSILSNLLKDVFTKEKHSGVSADDLSPSSVDPLIEQVNLKLTSGDIEGAEKIYKDAIEQFPGDTRLGALQTEVEFLRCLAIVDKRFPGPNYLEWLRWFHAMLKPGNYLEIGVESGQSLQFTRAPTRAVGIDPAIQIVHPQENWVKLFKQTSDDFFATRDPQQVFGSKIINLAFIDGLHTFDQALKDFINVERFSDARSVVLFHDIFPVVPATAQRNRTTRFWVGDTWKVMMILQKHRPDLK
ncbi:MAG: class I SAM-dependent methyltransferase, partial [Propionivibrio sp.]|nr:class I SAM-dependent methyltransferase [Propionivibrio sp.]